MGYAQKLDHQQTKVAFFSSTPLGGDVAPLRHALVRFADVLGGVQLDWYVPKPSPSVWRVMKDIRYTLQGIKKRNHFVPQDHIQFLTNWITENAQRYWLNPHGSVLGPPELGGADIIIIDDFQMACLIPIIKSISPNRPVLYRSHTQIRTDLVAREGSPQANLWRSLWSHIQYADMFLSHPIPDSVPHTVPMEKLAYLPPTIDLLDGRNKRTLGQMNDYYGHMYNQACHELGMTELDPERKYIAQVARFEPGKGVLDAIDAYAEFRGLCGVHGITEVPQLVMCGNRLIDDVDSDAVYDEALEHIKETCPQLAGDISVMRLELNDQLLNSIMSGAHVVLQLSTEEGFDVTVSEALYAERPVIVTNVGGISMQVKPNVNGFVVEPGDRKAVAEHLVQLFTDEELHAKMSGAAGLGVADEVTTVGNALSWYYLASKWAEPGGRVVGNGRWVIDMAREEAGVPYRDGEKRLPREHPECHQGAKRKRRELSDEVDPEEERRALGYAGMIMTHGQEVSSEHMARIKIPSDQAARFAAGNGGGRWDQV